MPIIPITTLTDPRIANYRNMKDRDLDRQGRRFLAEGEHLVRRLLASDFKTESLLVWERHVAEVMTYTPPDIPIYAIAPALMNEILGLKFHSGLLACGVRKPPCTLDQIIPRNTERLTLAICPETAHADNIGSMIRIAAAFGVDALLLGEKTHDPFWRQSVRVSMGTIFSLPIHQSADLQQDLRRLKSEWGVQLAATVLDPTAETLETATRPAKWGILFGNEAQGLDAEWVAACDRRITVPMHRGTDSLNVAISAGIFLYHFTRAMAFEPT